VTVVHGAGVIVDVGEHDDGGTVVDRGLQFVRLDELKRWRAPSNAGPALGDVKVGREVAALRDDDMPLRLQTQCGTEHLNRLTEVESATTTLPFAAPINFAISAATRSAKSIQPASFQLLIRPSPHSRYQLGNTARRCPRQRTERIAIQVDDPGRQYETLPEGCQRVDGTQTFEHSVGDHAPADSTVVMFRSGPLPPA
jgi:hypothetical protein